LQNKRKQTTSVFSTQLRFFCCFCCWQCSQAISQFFWLCWPQRWQSGQHPRVNCFGEITVCNAVIIVV